jgi:hypothetical protein
MRAAISGKRGFLMASNAALYRAGSGKRLLETGMEYDVFISAFNLSERIADTFSRIKAARKYWVIHNEYCFKDSEIPKDVPTLTSVVRAEGDFILDALNQIEPPLKSGVKLCIDITGFMRPHLMFLMNYLWSTGIIKFDLVYTEPSQYMRKADTVFSSDVVEVRQINGYEGVHSVDMSRDVLIVGAGYDHDLVSHVIANKSGARLIQLLSLPSLSADMYQESLIRLHKVSDAPFRVPEEQLAHASANDPFVTYIVLGEALKKIAARQQGISNIYLSPLATKPQAVGFAMYYLNHLIGKPASIIFPLASHYEKETSRGVGRAWLYEISFEAPRGLNPEAKN